MTLNDHGRYSGVVEIARNGIDEVIRLKAQAKQDEALIRQLLEALETCNDSGYYPYTYDEELVEKAAAAARARLEGKP